MPSRLFLSASAIACTVAIAVGVVRLWYLDTTARHFGFSLGPKGPPPTPVWLSPPAVWRSWLTGLAFGMPIGLAYYHWAERRSGEVSGQDGELPGNHTD